MKLTIGRPELSSDVWLMNRGEERNRSLAAVERATVEGRVLDIEYADKFEALSSRTVEPVAILGVQPHWYMWAYCRLREAPRVFRLDRIRSAKVLDERVLDRGLDPSNIELYELINRGILGDVSGNRSGRSSETPT